MLIFVTICAVRNLRLCRQKYSSFKFWHGALKSFARVVLKKIKSRLPIHGTLRFQRKQKFHRIHNTQTTDPYHKPNEFGYTDGYISHRCILILLPHPRLNTPTKHLRSSGTLRNVGWKLITTDQGCVTSQTSEYVDTTTSEQKPQTLTQQKMSFRYSNENFDRISFLWHA
jgi:hypothetical protein